MWLNAFLKRLPDQPYTVRIRTKFLVVAIVAVLCLLGYSLVSLVVVGHWKSAFPELAVFAFVATLLFLVWWGLPGVAVALLSSIVPVAFVLRLGNDPYYLLATASITLVLLTLVSSQLRFLLVAGTLYFAGGFVVVRGGTLAWATSIPVRYSLILLFLTSLLIVLQWVIARATKISVDSEQRLGRLVEERTTKLAVANHNFEQVRLSLASGDRHFSVGRVIARIAHQVNTPLAAIESSQKNLELQLFKTLQAWTNLSLSLPPGHFELLRSLLEAARPEQVPLSSTAARQGRAEHTAWLVQHGVANAEEIAELLTELGLARAPDQWLEVFRGEDCLEQLGIVLHLVELERSVAVVGRAAEKAAASIGELSRFAAGSGGEKEPLDVAESIEVVLTVLRDRLPGGVSLQADYPASRAVVYGISEQLLQVWNHLLLNALTAVGSQGRIDVSVTLVAHAVEVRFRDNGPGVPEFLRPVLLEPFLPAPESTADGHIGLGLEIAQFILQWHSGTLSFESQPGRTEFLVRLPLAASSLTVS